MFFFSFNFFFFSAKIDFECYLSASSLRILASKPHNGQKNILQTLHILISNKPMNAIQVRKNHLVHLFNLIHGRSNFQATLVCFIVI